MSSSQSAASKNRLVKREPVLGMLRQSDGRGRGAIPQGPSHGSSHAPGPDTEAVEDQVARRHIPLIARHDPRRIPRNCQLDKMIVGLIPEVRAPEIGDVDPLADTKNGIQQCCPVFRTLRPRATQRSASVSSMSLMKSVFCSSPSKNGT